MLFFCIQNVHRAKLNWMLLKVHLPKLVPRLKNELNFKTQSNVPNDRWQQVSAVILKHEIIKAVDEISQIL